jgi:hypothetical protein
LIAQVFLNWNGTKQEFESVKSVVKDQVANYAGVDLVGLYIPSNKWNYVVIYKMDNFENFLNFQKQVRIQLESKNLAKIPTRKLVVCIEEKKLN